MAVGSIVGRESVLRKTHFPRLVIPLAVVLTTLMNLGVNSVAVAIFILAWGVDPTWTWALFPIVLVLLVVLTTAVSVILSALYPRFRDTAILWSVLALVLFYGSPVLYPLEVVPDTLREIMVLNPLAPLLELARVWVIDPGAPGPVEAAGGAAMLAVPIAIYLGICALAVWIFKREAPRIAEQL